MANENAMKTDLAHADTLWKAADALRGQIDAAEYKHVVLGLLFLKYISDAFEVRREELKVELENDGIPGPPLESLFYDPCCGSAGMFVQPERFAGEHGGQKTETPGRSVGAEKPEEDSEPSAEKYPRLLAELEACFVDRERLTAVVREQLGLVGKGGTS